MGLVKKTVSTLYLLSVCTVADPICRGLYGSMGMALPLSFQNITTNVVRSSSVSAIQLLPS